MDSIMQKSQELLQNNNGIVFGENHLTPVAPDWIRTNLASFKDSGVTTLFMEIQNEHQPIIDLFMADGDETSLRKGLQFLGASAENEAAIESLIVDARAQGLKVVAMDVPDPTKYIKDDYGRLVEDKYNADRLQYSNPAWAERVKETMANQPEGAKYLMLVGEAHTDKTNDPRYRGVDSILGIPSIDIKDIRGAERHNSLADIYGNIEIPQDIIESAKLGKIQLIDGITYPEGNAGKESDYAGIAPSALEKTTADPSQIQPETLTR